MLNIIGKMFNIGPDVITIKAFKQADIQQGVIWSFREACWSSLTMESIKNPFNSDISKK